MTEHRTAPARRLRPGLRAFLADEAGSVKLEFMIAFPLLISWLVGSFVLFDLFWSYSQAEKATYVVGDLVSRVASVDDGRLAEYFGVYRAMTPRAVGTRAIRITSVGFDAATNDYTVLWSVVNDGDPQVNEGDVTPMTADDLPRDILPTVAPLESVILVQSFTGYSPIAYFLGARDLVFASDITIRPRFVSRVVYDDGTPGAGT